MTRNDSQVVVDRDCQGMLDYERCQRAKEEVDFLASANANTFLSGISEYPEDVILGVSLDAHSM
jgi:hypothetical protein